MKVSMKSAQKGIEMKLIQILALAIAMATLATAQNSTPSPTPTAASKSGSAAQPGTKKAATTGTQPATKAGTTATKAPAATPTPKPGTIPAKSGPAPATKGQAATTTIPAKGQTAAVPAKVVPTPVVAAKGADTKKADTKKADTKGTATKTPAVIPVNPKQPTKKTAATQTKPPVKTPPAKMTQATPAARPEEKPRPATKAFGGQHTRRDPFVSPIVAKGGVERPQPNCTNGKRCLVIPELTLQGTIKDTSGKMMAVVANSTRRTYFLRENDQVFQGSVEKITSDSIIFREYIKDALGRESAREVVKKLVPTT